MNKKLEKYGPEFFETFEEFKQALNRGEIRAAEPHDRSGSSENSANSASTGWRVNTWVKKGILLGFRIGSIVDMSLPDSLPFFDKNTYPLRPLASDAGVRVVPGGSSIRDGCFLGHGVTCMPPMFINAGAYVDDSTMIDSHALVGSCAQIGKRVHLSAATQIGGVLEPVGAMPVIVEDDVLIGGNCGIYEGTIVKSRAVIGAGTILTGSTPVYDLVQDRILRRNENTPLIIPSGAVVVPGSRGVTHGWGKEAGISLYTPVIVKYRDEKTDASIQLEDLLR